MAKSIARSVGAIVGVGFLLAACSGTKQVPNGGLGDVGGAGFSGSSTAGPPGGVGGVGGGTCIANSTRCDGSNVKLCDSQGLKETISQACLPSQTCSEGACVAGGCIPNSQFCKDGALWSCDSKGVASISQNCAFGLSCRPDGDNASCSPDACSPDQPVCAGDVATLCRSDGSGPTTGGVDCSNTKQACYGGKCREVACTNGEKLCDHGSVYLCSHNGTDISLLSTCRTDEVCDGDMSACRARLCEPGKVSCDGTRVQTCNAYGSAWLPGTVECATDGRVCVSGSCRKQVCAASRRYCQDGNAYECDATGTVATLRQTCNAQSEHCTSSGYCATNDCKAGDKLCVGNVVKVCNADGSLPSDGTICGDNQICDSAQCKDRPCEPGAFFCKGADVYQCNFGSSSPFFYLAQSCSPDTACKPLSTYNAACMPLPCSAGSKTCLGNKVGTCGSDGQSLSAVTTDCTTTANVCTSEFACAASAIDDLGKGDSNEQLYGGSLVGNVIDVDSPRKLTELQLLFVTVAPRDMRWIVYEMSGQYFVPKVDKLVSNVTSNGYTSSGALTGVNLVAGKRYLLAVVIVNGDGFDALDYQPFVSDLSFGTAVGRIFTTYSAGNLDAGNFDPSSVSQMKITTASP